MKTTSQFVLAGVLALLAGTVAPAYAHQGQHPSEGKPPKQEHQAKPEKQHQDKDKQQKDQNKKPPHVQQNAQPPHAQPQPPHVQQPHQQQATQQGRRVPRDEQRTVWQQRRARSWEAEHRTWQQRGGYNGYRIPQDRYQRYFGPHHRFRIYRYPMVVVGGYPRFQYGGFWFSLIDPWPEYWSNGWYDDDDVYIDYYEDGYYLYNPRYPRDRIAIVFYVH